MREGMAVGSSRRRGAVLGFRWSVVLMGIVIPRRTSPS
eukprot:CAMPEP_0172566954 /NCGR_PEP_ID=MMETSP1067-20121228/113938_1 /TAXON_ID=265564 ORGANISM="Thalassiosira punctigera, Strain Tpunct2005C2" /NCGR_SAMPLE_ID=MMETSP1067 /ASSEMBLY_ACC=CAM_ASM_000444 /LENGTH=37 /DNA_ID= /DNA_START= /DNA_END= /DNA_ORIENTATION=